MNLFFFSLSQKMPQYVNLNTLRKLENGANQTILLGFDNYTLETKALKFNAYFLLKNWAEDDIINNLPDSLKKPIEINTNITVDNNEPYTLPFNCNIADGEGAKDSEKNQAYKFICKTNYTDKVPKKIQIISNLTDKPYNGIITRVAPFANAYKNNLVDLKNSIILGEDLKFLENVTLIEHKGNYFKVKAQNNLGDYKSLQLIMFNNGMRKNIKCKGYYDDDGENYYYLESDGINPEINGDLQYSILNHTDKNNDINYHMLDFGPNEGNSTLTPDRPFYKKSTGGLSTGGIVAVLIPCLIVLLGIGALVYFLGMRKPSQAMTSAINNNTIGVASSENIMNK